MSANYGTFRGNPQRRPVIPCELRPPLAHKWYEDLGARPTHPLVGDGLVFVRRKDKKTVAKDEETGKTVWLSRSPGRPKALDVGRLLLYDRDLTVVEPQAGHLLKPIAGPGALEAAWLRDSLVAVTFSEGSSRLYVSSFETGALVWEHRLPEMSADPEGLRLAISSSFGATSDCVIFGVSGGTVQALRLRDGSRLWEASVADLEWELLGRGMKPGQAMGAVVINGDLALLEVLGGHVAALHVDTGERAWVWSEGPDLSECYLHGDRYYAHSGGGRIWAISPSTGRTVQSFDLYARMPAKVRMSIGEICGPFVVSETHFFTGSTTGYIAAFDRADGRYVWSDRPRGNRGCTYYNGNYFMAVNRRLYYGDQSFGIHCWEEDEPVRSHSVGSKSRGSAAARSPSGSKGKKAAARPGKGR